VEEDLIVVHDGVKIVVVTVLFFNTNFFPFFCPKISAVKESNTL